MKTVYKFNHSGKLCIGYRLTDVSYLCKFADSRVEEILDEDLTKFNKYSIVPSW